MALDRTNPLESEDSRRRPRPSRAKASELAGRTASHPSAGGAVSSAAAGELKIEVEIGGTVDQVHTFGPGEVHVGRRSRNDITIDGKGLKVVSNYHLRFVVEGGQWCVDDRDSTNGTFLNQVRVERIKPVRDGDTIDLGSPQRSGSSSGSPVRLRVSLPNQATSEETVEPATMATGTTKTMSAASLAPPNSALAKAMGVEDGLVPPPLTEPLNEPLNEPLPERDLSVTTGPVTISADLDDTDEAPRVSEFTKPSKVSLGRTMATPPDDEEAATESSGLDPQPEAPAKPISESTTVPSAHSEPSRSSEPSGPSEESSAPKVPAARPTELRALLESIREKSRRLGEVSYRLDAHVDDLAAAVVERHAALGVSELPGGAEVVASISKHEQLEASLTSIEEELPRLRSRLSEELAPLERVAASRKEEADSARGRLEHASDRATSCRHAFDARLKSVESALSMSLASLPGIGSSAEGSGSSEPSGAPVDSEGAQPAWKTWREGLEQALEHVKGGEAELGTLDQALRDSESARATSEEAAKQAADAWVEAQQEAEGRRKALELSIAEKESSLKETMAQLGHVRTQIDEQSKDFVFTVLGSSSQLPEAVARLAGMETARDLHRESEALRSEIRTLEDGAF